MLHSPLLFPLIGTLIILSGWASCALYLAWSLPSLGIPLVVMFIIGFFISFIRKTINLPCPAFAEIMTVGGCYFPVFIMLPITPLYIIVPQLCPYVDFISYISIGLYVLGSIIARLTTD